MSEKDELILDIIEKTYDKVEKLEDSVQEIKIEQSNQNIIVKQHEARSTASEARMTWIENRLLFQDACIKIVGGLATGGAVLAKVIPYLVAHL